jgi:hypothetical protein
MKYLHLKPLIALALGLACTYASAEKLIAVGAIDPIGIKIYADTDSLKKRAHISEIKAIALIDSIKRPDEIPFTFDCEKETYFLPDGKTPSVSKPLEWEKNGAKLSMSSRTLTNLLNISCKQWYEFWR